MLLIIGTQMNADIHWYSLLRGAAKLANMKGRGLILHTLTCPTAVSGLLPRLEAVQSEKEDTLETVV